MMSFMNYEIGSLPLLLASLFSLLSAGLLVKMLAKKSWMRFWKSGELRNAGPSTRPQSLIGAASRYGIAFFLGYCVCLYQFQSAQAHWVKQRFTYHDAVVTRRYDSRNFSIQPARMQAKDWTTCSPVDWQEGEKMRYVIFSQREGCKDVVIEGEYDFYKANGQRLKFPIKEIASGF